MKINSKVKILIPVFIVSALVLAYQNCANKVAFNTATEIAEASQALAEPGNTATTTTLRSTVVTTTTTLPTEADGDLGHDDLPATCAQKRSSGQTLSSTTVVSFPKETQACAWGLNGNLSTLDTYVRARKEQYSTLNLPVGATICNIQMSHLQQADFYYDDNIIMTLNDFIFASTTNFNENFLATAASNGSQYYKYAWDRLVGKPGKVLASDSTPENQYCAGIHCLFPVTQNSGAIELNIGQTAIQNILTISNPQQLKLGVITTGDDNNADCIHEPLNLSVTVEYYR
jgi:hypothetical protein